MAGELKPSKDRRGIKADINPGQRDLSVIKTACCLSRGRASVFSKQVRSGQAVLSSLATGDAAIGLGMPRAISSWKRRFSP